MAGQLGLFENDHGVDQAQAAEARARMAGMIARLREACEPPWKDEAGVILDDGSFRRAMLLVPDGEAQALWAAYDAEMERLYAVFSQARV